MNPIRALSSSLLLLAAAAAPAQMLTFTAPNVTTPGSVTLANSNVGVADTLALSYQADWSVILSQVLDAQGYTSGNGWSYSLLHITSLATNAVYNVLDGAGNFNNGNPVLGYKLRSAGGNPSTNNKLDESMHVTLSLGSTTAPSVDGATVTQHWIQLLHEDRQYPISGGGYGFSIIGQSGFWQIDNGDKTFTRGSGFSPFYDVAFGGWSASEVGDDPTVLSDGLAGAYLRFTMLPVWDVQTGTGTNMVDSLYVGNAGFSWGFSVVPEPSSIALFGSAAATSVAIYWRRRRIIPS